MQCPAISDRARVMRLGQQFESARRFAAICGKIDSRMGCHRACCFAFRGVGARITPVTSVIRNSGGSSLLGIPTLRYTRADESTKGDEMLSGAGGPENTSKAPTYPDLAGKVAVVTGGSG